MRHRTKDGFTFVEIMTVLALIAVLVAIAWGKFNRSYEKALRATMISDLRNTMTGQELYYRLYQTYAPSIDLVNIEPSPKSDIYITESSPLGWAAWNEIERSTERCEVYIGNASSALGFAETSSKIVCQKP
jgi:prepilin-type N-terminal cleavage/methylation domain-containing protein